VSTRNEKIVPSNRQEPLQDNLPPHPPISRLCPQCGLFPRWPEVMPGALQEIPSCSLCGGSGTVPEPLQQVRALP